MRSIRRAGLLGLIVIALAACGSTSTTTLSAASTPSASAAPSSAASALTGHYAGNWNNQTFSTTGTAAADVDVQLASKKVTFTITLGGNVFGGSAPPPQTFTGTLTSDGGANFSSTSDFFGACTATVAAGGSFTADCPSVPGGHVSNLHSTGTVSTQTFSFNYDLTLAGGSKAHGVVNLTRT